VHFDVFYSNFALNKILNNNNNNTNNNYTKLLKESGIDTAYKLEQAAHICCCRGHAMLPVCLVSFNSTKPRLQTSIITYCGFRFTTCQTKNSEQENQTLMKYAKIKMVRIKAVPRKRGL